MKRSERLYWLRFSLGIGIIYAGLSGWALMASDSMIFFPNYASRAEPEGFVKVEMEDGSGLSAVFLSNPKARLTLWHFHGNAEALGDIMPRLKELREFGFNVFSLEYPGYGTSYGRPTEARIYASLGAGLRYLENELKITPGQLVVHGRSLGGGPAVELATRENVAGLILESTFTSAYRVVTRWPLLPGDKFKNLKKLSAVHCPVLVIHGRSDRTIPFHHGESLYAAVRSKSKQHLWVNLAGHNDLRRWAGELYQEAIVEFTQNL
jgi:abhydrolase domain-containing protein 17